MAKRSTILGNPKCSFDLTGIRSVVVRRFADSSVTDAPFRIITDGGTIASIVGILSAFPRTGIDAKTIDAADERIEADFFRPGSDGSVSRIELLGGRVRSPDGNFLGPEENGQEELRLLLLSKRPEPRYAFKIAGATLIRINDYDHAVSQTDGSAPDRWGEIDDPVTIAEAIALLSEMPEKGEIFASLTGQIPLTEVFFNVPGEEQELRISFYGQALRAPDGSFFAEPSARAKQKELIELLRAALAPH